MHRLQILATRAAILRAGACYWNRRVYLAETVAAPEWIVVFTIGYPLHHAAYANWQTIGLNYPTHPLIGHLIWIPFCVAFRILLQMVYVRAQSIFPVALCYGLTNQFGMLTLGLVVAEDRARDLVDGPAGLFALVVVALPAIYCYRQFDDRRR
ncbi:MAG TPA: hypothetical protein VII30_07180 [Gemmatimonadaceae bacterium]